MLEKSDYARIKEMREKALKNKVVDHTQTESYRVSGAKLNIPEIMARQAEKQKQRTEDLGK